MLSLALPQTASSARSAAWGGKCSGHLSMYLSPENSTRQRPGLEVAAGLHVQNEHAEVSHASLHQSLAASKIAEGW